MLSFLRHFTLFSLVCLALGTPLSVQAQEPAAELELRGVAGFRFGMTEWQARDVCGDGQWSFREATDRLPLPEGRCNRAPRDFATYTPRTVRVSFCPQEAGPPVACRFWTAGGGFHLRELLLQLTRKYGNAASRERAPELEAEAECAEAVLTLPELEGETALIPATPARRGGPPAARRNRDNETEGDPWAPALTCTRWALEANAEDATQVHRLVLNTRNARGSFSMWETRIDYRAGGFDAAYTRAIEEIRTRLREQL